ncbi:MAG: hypothetical protein PCFJNLEI_02597 [Verrucomicrobiae bacterium]|nr:hypothetical protein [Verrucomicrobiae bacterium]
MKTQNATDLPDTSGTPVRATPLNWLAQREADVRAASEPVEGDTVCPTWLTDDVPERFQQFVARRGLPEPFHSGTTPLGMRTRGIDRWQANHFLVHNEQTRDFIEREYTPRRVEYVGGMLPVYEKLAARYGGEPREFLTKALPKHPTIPPFGPVCPTNRGLDDETLVRSGVGFCNEQARVFVRLCQVSGIPARLIFLFYADRKTGHTTAEYLRDGRWVFVDVSWRIEVAGLSTAECHGQPEVVRRAYAARQQALSAVTPEARAMLETRRDEFWVFGVLNYPLPI